MSASPYRWRRTAAAAAACAAAALGASSTLITPALAAPAPSAQATTPASTPATISPADILIRAEAAPNPVAAQAGRAIARAEGTASSGSDLLQLLQDANDLAREFGIEPFLWPSIAPFCSALPDAPLGIVPAVAGAVPGPYPGIPPLDPILVDPIDLNAVRAGETLFAFVPAGIVDDSDSKTGMYLAWFNISTLQGGFTELGGVSETLLDGVLRDIPTPLAELARRALEPIVARLPSAGVRLAAVQTGNGTVLSVILGTVTHNVGGAPTTCYFLPTVGITQVSDPASADKAPAAAAATTEPAARPAVTAPATTAPVNPAPAPSAPATRTPVNTTN